MRIKKFDEYINEAKLQDIKAGIMNVKSLIQIVDEDDKNVAQAKITKVLKTLYHVNYKSGKYKIKIPDVAINIHGQAQCNLDKLIEVKK